MVNNQEKKQTLQAVISVIIMSTDKSFKIIQNMEWRPIKESTVSGQNNNHYRIIIAMI